MSDISTITRIKILLDYVHESSLSQGHQDEFQNILHQLATLTKLSPRFTYLHLLLRELRTHWINQNEGMVTSPTDYVLAVSPLGTTWYVTALKQQRVPDKSFSCLLQIQEHTSHPLHSFLFELEMSPPAPFWLEETDPNTKVNLSLVETTRPRGICHTTEHFRGTDAHVNQGPVGAAWQWLRTFRTSMMGWRQLR